MSRRTLFASLLLSAACSAAYADQPVTGPALPRSSIALSVAPTRLRAPYEVQILRDDGELLPTYAFRDRFYIEGSANERYIIRITNPTPRRIEAVVSVDGLDVIDGENGDLRKRGYVVPAYGETRIEGFRTSQADVATFRFSSVGNSYAGLKGKARNVGVIAVALFEERGEPAPIIVGGRHPRRVHRPYEDRDLDYGARGGADASVAPAPPAARNAAKAESGRAAPAASAPTGGYAPADVDADDEVAMPAPRTFPRERPGLGTEFGEQRYSAASYTRFVRAAGRPVAIAELRYNDASGLIALGIPVQPMPDDRELMLRETANPFPGDRFARPPR